jgi:hypothetical protein
MSVFQKNLQKTREDPKWTKMAENSACTFYFWLVAQLLLAIAVSQVHASKQVWPEKLERLNKLLTSSWQQNKDVCKSIWEFKTIALGCTWQKQLTQQQWTKKTLEFYRNLEIQNTTLGCIFKCKLCLICLYYNLYKCFQLGDKFVCFPAAIFCQIIWLCYAKLVQRCPCTPLHLQKLVNLPVLDLVCFLTQKLSEFILYTSRCAVLFITVISKTMENPKGMKFL